MKDLHHSQWLIFWGTSVIVTALLLLRMAALAPLYGDPELRQRTMALVEGTATREGWLLSDIELQRVRWGSLQLLHRSHVRGVDPVTCHRLNLHNGTLTPCEPH